MLDPEAYKIATSGIFVPNRLVETVVDGLLVPKCWTGRLEGKKTPKGWRVHFACKYGPVGSIVAWVLQSELTTDVTNATENSYTVDFLVGKVVKSRDKKEWRIVAAKASAESGHFDLLVQQGEEELQTTTQSVQLLPTVEPKKPKKPSETVGFIVWALTTVPSSFSLDFIILMTCFLDCVH